MTAIANQMSQVTVLASINSKYNFKKIYAKMYTKKFDGGVIFLELLSDKKTFRVSVGDEEDALEYHTQVDLFEFQEIEKLDKFISLLDF